ncbi:helix-turn-helix domain-containing protein [Nocardioides piscis]|uniref:Helix-turn-helix transcriptional regulator n=1 Tax=Nocardioides piscis TaxID=2714938 RepID=A0A6G7YH92_9ACTN|nr:helix-turn-helix transcriptional regulator [Nocardioides piscis]QIK76036.1 helix-turn-helix transcriptional regulator [Nocardioides piscis]
MNETTTSAPDPVALARVRHLVASGTAKHVRVSAEVSQVEIAQAIGVTHAAISNWENGIRKPRGHAALRYLAVLDGLMGRAS